jgi:Mg/Co/Ni transporter MgtE
MLAEYVHHVVGQFRIDEFHHLLMGAFSVGWLVGVVCGMTMSNLIWTFGGRRE